MIARVLAWIVILLIAVGCVGSGNKALKDETRESVAEKLHKGQDKEEVRAMFGDPISTDFDGGYEEWKYVFSQSQSNIANFIPYASLLYGGTTGTHKELTILFDSNDRVAKYSMNESATQTDTGIVQ
jgi:outer membrane protein assembly factor BamE (lipoprotein component of BamABCDE complex)